ncbi:MAG TPA: DEDD exonuclease domain-containing protein [Frankiaceae bacterium]|jgi:DNA polymerase-3 subunit epsilon|nr:DEDD exonuclease domain-containing protein [Frankiaceae bacterium]
MSPAQASLARQPLLDEAIPASERPVRELRELTFVIVDLETTGGSPAGCDITEIGAVKVRGGEVLGEFATLVRPSAEIPPFISVLTGITDAMVAGSPRPAAALPAFLEFARGCVLVAHNAPFDMGFLRAGCEQLGLTWPAFEVVDTALLARRILTRDETPNCKLSTLALFFRAVEQPCHRALADARATVDVLHGLFERLGPLGVTTMDELRTFTGMVPAAVRRKRHLADDLPNGPGVYLFRDGQGRALYIGTSRNVRTRVRSYFTASELRTRMAEMVGIAEAIDAVPCAHSLEAEVRELRLIAEHKPRYNRRSRWPERSVWLKLTVEPFPRLSQVRVVRDDGATYLGPFGSTRPAELAAIALHEAFPLRQCGGRLAVSPHRAACVLAELARCGAPCTGGQSREEYAVHVADAHQAITANPGAVVDALRQRMDRLSGAGRFEDAGRHRDRLIAFVRAAARRQRLAALTGVEEMVAALPDGAGGWELSVIRYGRLVAAGRAPAGAGVRPYVAALKATAETVVPGPGPLPAASAEEVECVLRWLERPGARLVECSGTWASPAFGAARHREWLVSATERSAIPLGKPERRNTRPTARPARAEPGAGMRPMRPAGPVGPGRWPAG